MGRAADISSITNSIRAYKTAMREGRRDIAEGKYKEVMDGIAGLRGMVDIKGVQERMRLEGAEETRKQALHPAALRREEAAATGVELETGQLRTQLDEERKTRMALEKQLAELGVTGTPESLRLGEEAAGIVARRREGIPEATAAAGKRKLTADEFLTELTQRITKARLAGTLPEAGVEVEEKKTEAELRTATERLRTGAPELAVGAEAAEAKAGREEAELRTERAEALREEGIAELEATVATQLLNLKPEEMQSVIDLRKATAARYGETAEQENILRSWAESHGKDYGDVVANMTLAKAAQPFIQTLYRAMDARASIMSATGPAASQIIIGLGDTPLASVVKPEADKEGALKELDKYIKAQKQLLLTYFHINWDKMEAEYVNLPDALKRAAKWDTGFKAYAVGEEAVRPMPESKEREKEAPKVTSPAELEAEYGDRLEKALRQ